LKILTNSKSCPERSIKIQFSFAIIGQFSPVYIHGRLSEQLSESRVAFGTTFNVTDGYWKAGTSSLKKVSGAFTISK
jgi:hypothetical protein